MSYTMVAVNMKIVVCIERCLFLFFGFYTSFVLVDETMDVVLTDFDILLVAFMVLSDFTVLLFYELVKS